MFWHRDLTSCLWLLLFDGLWSYWHLGSSLLGIPGWSQILTYLSFHTQTFHHGYFHAFYLTRAWSSHSFILHIPPWHMTSPFSRLGGDIDQSSITLVVFSCILLDFRFNIFHDGRAWQIADLLVLMLSFWQLACWVLILLVFRISGIGHHCFYSSVLSI